MIHLDFRFDILRGRVRFGSKIVTVLRLKPLLLVQAPKHDHDSWEHQYCLLPTAYCSLLCRRCVRNFGCELNISDLFKWLISISATAEKQCTRATFIQDAVSSEDKDRKSARFAHHGPKLTGRCKHWCLRCHVIRWRRHHMCAPAWTHETQAELILTKNSLWQTLISIRNSFR